MPVEYPPPQEGYVRDRNGIIWTLVHDGGMATTATYTKQYSCGIVWLENNYGPLEYL